MAWWAAAAPIFGAAIDAFTGSRQARKAPQRAGQTAYNENFQGLVGRVEAAKSLGLHPTSVLGGSFGGSGALPVGSDFTSAFSQAGNIMSQQRQYKAENAMRRIQEKRLSTEMKNAQTLTQAQIRHIEKQSSWIDEQIAASKEARLRENLKSQRAGTGFRGDAPLVSGPNGPMVEYKPNEVVRHTGGVTHGVGPSRDLVMDSDGTIYARPHASQAEQSEVMNTLQDLASHFGVPLTHITGGGGKLQRDFRNFIEDERRKFRSLPRRIEKFIKGRRSRPEH